MSKQEPCRVALTTGPRRIAASCRLNGPSPVGTATVTSRARCSNAQRRARARPRACAQLFPDYWLSARPGPVGVGLVTAPPVAAGAPVGSPRPCAAGAPCCTAPPAAAPVGSPRPSAAGAPCSKVGDSDFFFMSYLAEADPDRALTPLQAAACTYRIALGPRAWQTAPIWGGCSR